MTKLPPTEMYSGDPSRVISMAEDRIEFELAPISEKDVSAFRTSLSGIHGAEVPPTFPTRFRWGEFRWMERLNIVMTQLLHAEQEYSYQRPLRIGDVPRVCTRLKESKERRGLRFVVFENEYEVGGERVGTSRTLFVIRPTGESTLGVTPS